MAKVINTIVDMCFQKLLFSPHIGVPVDLINSNKRFLVFTATLFLEFWKRHRASYVCEWKVSDWCEEEVWSLLNIIICTLCFNYILFIPGQCLLEFVDVIFFSFYVVGGTDPGNCERCQLWTKRIQALLPAQHSGFDLCHSYGGCYFYTLQIWYLKSL